MNKKQGQSTLEFSFAMVVIVMLIYGLIKVFQFVGMDYAEHAWDREHKVALEIADDGSIPSINMSRTKRMNAFTRLFLR